MFSLIGTIINALIVIVVGVFQVLGAILLFLMGVFPTKRKTPGQ